MSTPTVTAPLPAGQAESPPKLPPGPHLPYLLQSYLTWQRLVPWLHWTRKRYGDVFTLRTEPWGRAVVVADPELIKQVLTGPAETLHAGDGNRILEPVLGSQSVLVLDEDEHLTTRKRLLPPFHGEAVQSYEQVVRDETRARVEQWPIGKPFRMDRETRAVTLEVILRAVIGVEDSPRLGELRRVLSRATRVSFVISLMWMRPSLEHLPPWKTYMNAIRRANELLIEEIDERRRAPDLDERGDVLSLLIRSGETEEGWLRDQIMSLLEAGHETTTTGLAWAMELLAHNPEVRERARQGDDAYLDAVIQETLRLRPVIPGIARKLTAPMHLGEYHLPEGVTIVPGIAHVHSNPRIYPDPDSFRPERFLDQRPGTYTWFPFGGGRRRCIGASFAVMEMRVALRTILDTVDWKPASRRMERQANYHITLVPARGARIVRTR